MQPVSLFPHRYRSACRPIWVMLCLSDNIRMSQHSARLCSLVYFIVFHLIICWLKTNFIQIPSSNQLYPFLNYSFRHRYYGSIVCVEYRAPEPLSYFIDRCGILFTNRQQITLYKSRLMRCDISFYDPSSLDRIIYSRFANETHRRHRWKI